LQAVVWNPERSEEYMEVTVRRSSFLSAADLACEVVSSSGVAERWHNPSALAEFSVGGIAGHTYLAARILERRLDTEVPEDPEVIDALERYSDIRIVDTASLEDEVHRGVRHDGEYVARRGPVAVAGKFHELLDRLRSRLPDEPPGRLVVASTPGTVMLLDDFLSSRTIEMLVHADDLAVSVGLPPLDLPPDAAKVATTTLLELARQRAGDLAVLRALTRRERQESDILYGL